MERAMAAGHINRVVGRLRRVALGTMDVRSDAQLLEGFILRRDAAAFELLLRRHGPMVLGVCRRLLGNEADAEDAFQATFLVLVRRAAQVVPREQVGNWLYGVAYRTALKARAMNGKRRARERQAGARSAVAAGPLEHWPELQAILDQELERLPPKYRAPVVLCDLEGKTHREAARLLGWPDGTLSTRLTAARRLLAGRLQRRGLTLSVGVVAALMAQHAAPAAVPEALTETTVLAVAGTAAGVSIKVAALTEGVLKAMLIAKLKTTAGVVLGVLLLGAVAGGLAYPGNGAAHERAGQPDGAAPADPPAAGERARAIVLAGDKRDLRGIVTEVDGQDGLVKISLGSDDHVAVGDKLEVYRLKPQPRYVGQATVIDVVPHACVGRLRSINNNTPAHVGDQVATQLFNRDANAPVAPRDQQKQEPPPADVQGVVSRIDGGNNLVEVSLGSDDGIKEGQVLHVYRLAPTAAYLGPIKLLATFRRSAVARPSEPLALALMTAGDKVSAAMPSLPPRTPSAPPKPGGPDASTPVPRASAGHVAERFLAGAVSGKHDDIRGLLQPKLPKASVDQLARKDVGAKAPPLALVMVDTDEAVAISEGYVAPLVEPSPENAANPFAGPARTRILVRLKRASLEQMMSGWFAADWLVAEVHVQDGHAALNSLTDFLRRHPDARIGPGSPLPKATN
jgi:RNA polymerase sigma factor (sigma-70 family)